MALSDVMQADLQNVFFADFATKVRPDTWGGCDIDAIFDKDLIDLDEASLVAPHILVPTVSIPSTATQGDLLTIEGVTYEVLDIQYEEPDVSRIVLRKP